jgi:hypothetical protein
VPLKDKTGSDDGRDGDGDRGPQLELELGAASVWLRLPFLRRLESFASLVAAEFTAAEKARGGTNGDHRTLDREERLTLSGAATGRVGDLRAASATSRDSLGSGGGGGGVLKGPGLRLTILCPRLTVLAMLPRPPVAPGPRPPPSFLVIDVAQSASGKPFVAPPSEADFGGTSSAFAPFDCEAKLETGRVAVFLAVQDGDVPENRVSVKAVKILVAGPVNPVSPPSSPFLSLCLSLSRSLSFLSLCPKP